MILLFVFFVTLFSFTYKKLGHGDFRRIAAILNHEKASAEPLDEIQQKLLKWVVDRNLLESVSVEQKEDALILQIKEKVLFPQGGFSLREESHELVKVIGTALEKVPPPYRIGIEGHTDDIPMSGSHISDNWELSAKRAHSVLMALNLKEEIRERTVIMGYGEMKPIAPNRTRDGMPIVVNQLQNRRVTIRIF